MGGCCGVERGSRARWRKPLRISVQGKGHAGRGLEWRSTGPGWWGADWCLIGEVTSVDLLYSVALDRVQLISTRGCLDDTAASTAHYQLASDASDRRCKAVSLAMP